MAEQGTVIKGRYRLERLLGEGGAAEVWLARDERLNRPVALKLLRRQYARDEALLERFRREARTVAQLSSPHIVQVYGVDVEEDPRFIVMEYVDGSDLKELLRFEAPLPVARALKLLRDIAAGVAVAHEAGLVHRDLKPGNILLSRRGEVKVTDFGIARDVASAGLTEPGTVWGTSHYLAPEQATGRPVSPATDVYALGVILFEMLTGTVPYPGDDPVAVAIAHIQEPEPDVQERNPAVPANIARLITRMMAKAPERRPASGAALVELLEGYLNEEGDATIVRPTLAADQQAGRSERATPPPTPAATPSLSPGRRPRPALLGGSTLVFLALCVLIGMVGMVVTGLPGLFASNSEEPPVATATIEVAGGGESLPTLTTEPTAAGEPTEQLPSPTPAPSPTSTLPPLVLRTGNGPDARAFHTSQARPVHVDGNLSEWTSEPVPLLNAVYGAEQWSGPSDLSGEIYFAWDEEFLYYAVRRTDDSHLLTNEHLGFELYRGDSVELWLDAQLLADFEEEEPNGDDFQLAFSPGDFAGIRAEGVIYWPDRKEEWNRQLRVHAEPLPDGYTLEARIPWSLLGVTPHENLVLGYAALLNDNDPPISAEPQTQLAHTMVAPYRKPRTFGNLILSR